MDKIPDTKTKLMDTAITLIWNSNYSNVGVAQICKDAGVTKGSFYHYFESKADLFYESSKYHWDTMKVALDEIYSPEHSSLDQLEKIIEYITCKQEENSKEDSNPVSGCPFFTAGGQAGTGEEKVRLAALEMSDKAIKYNTVLVKNLKYDNLLNSDIDPEQAGRMIFQYVMGLLIYGRVRCSLEAVKQDLRESIYRIIDLKKEHRSK